MLDLSRSPIKAVFLAGNPIIGPSSLFIEAVAGNGRSFFRKVTEMW